MTTPDQKPDTELEAQELTDEILEEASGGARSGPAYDLAGAGIALTWSALADGAGGNGGTGGNGGDASAGSGVGLL